VWQQIAAENPRISVVIATAARREDCKRAIASALEGEVKPLEVLLCDDASTDGTEQDIRAWAEEEPRLRYVRLPQNHGGPSPARNLGIREARGDWIAILDDDDLFKPEKLAVQSEYIATGRYDVVASDAERTSGGAYFGLTEPAEPSQDEFLRHNPIIVSSAVIRRTLLLSVGGFPERVGPISLKGPGDYGLWLALAYAGARFVVVPEQLLLYGDHGEGRMSKSVFHLESEIAAVKWRLWTQHPGNGAVLLSALRGSADAARWGLRGLRERRADPAH
jgi:glycosyltransferase involved in cell wall biosynthesis